MGMLSGLSESLSKSSLTMLDDAQTDKLVCHKFVNGLSRLQMYCHTFVKTLICQNDYYKSFVR
jgi:hypothetical protein